jgi:hypothetical protein
MIIRMRINVVNQRRATKPEAKYGRSESPDHDPSQADGKFQIRRMSQPNGGALPRPASGCRMHTFDSADLGSSNPHGEETVIARMGNDGCLEP